MQNNNTLLTQNSFPMFSNIVPEDIEPTLKKILSENRHLLTQLLKTNTIFTWENLFVPLEEMDDKLSKMWSPVGHMHAVVESEALRTAYNACLPLLTEYHTDIMQNADLCKAIQSIADGPEYYALNAAQRKIIDNSLRDFRLAGVDLSPEKKLQYAELQKKLSKLSTQFSENILDATQAWTMHVTDAQALLGMPEAALKIAEQNALQRDLKGWVFTLDYASYSTVMKYLAHRELRWLMYEAYVTRASDQGPHAKRFDNTVIIEDIIKYRHELACLLGFKNFAEYSLATKMADTPKRVLDFLNDLVEKSKPAAEKEMQELQAFARETDRLEKIEAWDMPYYSEKLRQAKYALSQEDLRIYFPSNQVFSGMFAVVSKLYGLRIVERTDVDTWHPQVQFFEVYDKANQLRGYFYTDLFARAHKREGAWMDECRDRRSLVDGTIQYPVAFLTCNFTRPLGNKPALLTHEDVQTLFHEFGHVLHHILTQVNYAALSGINGVAWDAVEFPSQFLEFWCFEKEALALISSHAETAEPLPDALYNKLIAAKNFQAGMHMLRQLEFALFDFRLHLEYDPTKEFQVQSLLDDVRNYVAVYHSPHFNRFQHSFSHIFSGGYAAGYYSYKWAEVLSADAFELFDEKGIFDATTGQKFLTNILEKGGLSDPMELYVAFRGREPTIDALIKYSGLTNLN